MDEPKNRVGRPCKNPPWLGPVAESAAKGLTLRRALWKHHINISEKELRSLYRLKVFREHYETARREYMLEWGELSQSAMDRILRRIG
jgi:hypothetical protein